MGKCIFSVSTAIFIFGGQWLCNVSNLDQIFKFLTKIQHYLPHRRLAYKLYKPFPVHEGLIQAQDGVGEVNQWLCGCVVSILKCPIFKMKQIKFWKIVQYTTHQWDCFVLHFVKFHQDLRSLYNFCVVHFEMPKKAFTYYTVQVYIHGCGGTSCLGCRWCSLLISPLKLNSRVRPSPPKMNGCIDAHHEYTGRNNAKLILHWPTEMQTTRLFTSHVIYCDFQK